MTTRLRTFCTYRRLAFVPILFLILLSAMSGFGQARITWSSISKPSDATPPTYRAKGNDMVRDAGLDSLTKLRMECGTLLWKGEEAAAERKFDEVRSWARWQKVSGLQAEEEVFYLAYFGRYQEAADTLAQNPFRKAATSPILTGYCVEGKDNLARYFIGQRKMVVAAMRKEIQASDLKEDDKQALDMTLFVLTYPSASRKQYPQYQPYDTANGGSRSNYEQAWLQQRPYAAAFLNQYPNSRHSAMLGRYYNFRKPAAGGGFALTAGPTQSKPFASIRSFRPMTGVQMQLEGFGKGGGLGVSLKVAQSSLSKAQYYGSGIVLPQGSPYQCEEINLYYYRQKRLSGYGRMGLGGSIGIFRLNYVGDRTAHNYTDKELKGASSGGPSASVFAFRDFRLFSTVARPSLYHMAMNVFSLRVMPYVTVAPVKFYDKPVGLAGTAGLTLSLSCERRWEVDYF